MAKWKFSPERLPLYIFPGFLMGIEVLLRSAASIDTRAFVGPIISFCWVAIFGSTFIWAVTLYLSTRSPNIMWWIFPCQKIN